MPLPEHPFALPNPKEPFLPIIPQQISFEICSIALFVGIVMHAKQPVIGKWRAQAVHRLQNGLIMKLSGENL